jgi:multisubunit Na+/H+ antiporter MnhE subunit
MLRFNSGRRGRQRITSLVIVTDKDFQGDLQCTISNEKISAQPKVVTIDADDSHTVRRVNFMGREFESTLSHNDSGSDVEVRSLEFEIQQDQDLI